MWTLDIGYKLDGNAVNVLHVDELIEGVAQCFSLDWENSSSGWGIRDVQLVGSKRLVHRAEKTVIAELTPFGLQYTATFRNSCAASECG